MYSVCTFHACVKFPPTPLPHPHQPLPVMQYTCRYCKFYFVVQVRSGLLSNMNGCEQALALFSLVWSLNFECMVTFLLKCCICPSPLIVSSPNYISVLNNIPGCFPFNPKNWLEYLKFQDNLKRCSHFPSSSIQNFCFCRLNGKHPRSYHLLITVYDPLPVQVTLHTPPSPKTLSHAPPGYLYRGDASWLWCVKGMCTWMHKISLAGINFKFPLVTGQHCEHECEQPNLSEFCCTPQDEWLQSVRINPVHWLVFLEGPSQPLPGFCLHQGHNKLMVSSVYDKDHMSELWIKNRSESLGIYYVSYFTTAKISFTSTIN